MKRKEHQEWENTYQSELQIGSMVKVLPECQSYESEYDENTEYMVTYLYVDTGGLNIGLNEGGKDSWSCGTDGYRTHDLKPI